MSLFGWIRNLFRRRSVGGSKVEIKPVINSEDVRKISSECSDLIREFEAGAMPSKYYPLAYDDGTGVLTIGIGTIKYPNGMRVKEGDICNLAQALTWLEFELLEKRNAVQTRDSELGLDLTQNEFDALVSLCYNIGIARLWNTGSTLGGSLLTKDRKRIAQSFLVYDKAGGKTMRGLTRRRHAEMYLFTGEKSWKEGLKI